MEELPGGSGGGNVVGLWWGCWDQAPELIEEEMQVGAAWGGAAIQGKGL